MWNSLYLSSICPLPFLYLSSISPQPCPLSSLYPLHILYLSYVLYLPSTCPLSFICHYLFSNCPLPDLCPLPVLSPLPVLYPFSVLYLSSTYSLPVLCPLPVLWDEVEAESLVYRLGRFPVQNKSHDFDTLQFYNHYWKHSIYLLYRYIYLCMYCIPSVSSIFWHLKCLTLGQSGCQNHECANFKVKIAW